ncbi:phosphoglycolate phosphatase [Aestuariibacter salexigens]|uniref:phosphoglycolate phosphatase n=1 Tax=Aestuariibacter salexigens TaxID=226010 RepID=UPI00040D83FF|nr:phosphoglycolate phosphatase [Aestuariibacter salexigens]
MTTTPMLSNQPRHHVSTLAKVPDAVFFDLDGTLLDTAPDLIAALDHVLASEGLPRSNHQQARAFASHGAMGLLTFGFAEHLDRYDAEALRQRFLEYYSGHIAQHTRLFTGVENALKTLRECAVPWGIITNKPIGLTEKLLPHYEILSESVATLGGDSLAQRKPHPAPLIHAAKQIGVDPTRCWYVGDAERDMQAANRAGMVSIVAHWGYIGPNDDVHTWHADAIISAPEQLTGYWLV